MRGGRNLLEHMVHQRPLFAQSGPSPYRTVDDWAKLPNGRQMGAVGKVTTDPDGDHIWAVIRCDASGEFFGTECLNSDLDPVVKFDLDGNVVESFGPVRSVRRALHAAVARLRRAAGGVCARVGPGIRLGR